MIGAPDDHGPVRPPPAVGDDAAQDRQRVGGEPVPAEQPAGGGRRPAHPAARAVGDEQHQDRAHPVEREALPHLDEEQQEQARRLAAPGGRLVGHEAGGACGGRRAAAPRPAAVRRAAPAAAAAAPAGACSGTPRTMRSTSSGLFASRSSDCAGVPEHVPVVGRDQRHRDVDLVAGEHRIVVPDAAVVGDHRLVDGDDEADVDAAADVDGPAARAADRRTAAAPSADGRRARPCASAMRRRAAAARGRRAGGARPGAPRAGRRRAVPGRRMRRRPVPAAAPCCWTSPGRWPRRSPR